MLYSMLTDVGSYTGGLVSGRDQWHVWLHGVQ